MRLSKKIRKPVPRRSGSDGENPLRPWGKDYLAMRDQCALATNEQLEAEWPIARDRAGRGDRPFAGFAMSDLIVAELRSREKE
jgi:hypothetical protein